MKSASIAAAALLLSLIATTPDRAEAFQIVLPDIYQWKVMMPSDIPFESCTITMHAGGHYKTVELHRGQTYTWISPKNTPLTDVSAWRVDAYRNRIYLVGRTCTGTDYENGYNQVECKHSVNVKICAKPAFPADPIFGAKYGFCPD